MFKRKILIWKLTFLNSFVTFKLQVWDLSIRQGVDKDKVRESVDYDFDFILPSFLI